MGDPTGFLKYERKVAPLRPVAVRIKDWKEVYEEFSDQEAKMQSARCMDCGIPFCHEGCPLGNIIPEFNDLVYKGRLEEAKDRLLATNNFPEFTGRLCPAPCEGACVLGINADPVSIKQIEHYLADLIFEDNLAPFPIEHETGKKVAIVGSGPSGLAAAQQLRRAGHSVTVFERAENIGGLLRYGIPEFKLEKNILDARLTQMEKEGVVFKTNVFVGKGNKAEVAYRFGKSYSDDAEVVPAETLYENYDAIVLACGSTLPRDLNIKGRELNGIYFAMDYLKAQNLVNEERLTESPISAKDKYVVIIGGGDTGADCLGTANRQGAKSVVQIEILNRPPDNRAPDNPWPQYPYIFRISPAHEEGCERIYGITAIEFVGDKNNNLSELIVCDVEKKVVDSTVVFEPLISTKRSIRCDLALLAMGFSGPEKQTVVSELDLKLNERGNIFVDKNWKTSREKVFACGDMVRGQSLIVWAIAEGRSLARSVDEFLMGESFLPAVLEPYQLLIA